MKGNSIKQIAFIGFIIAFIFVSCSVEKRVYMSGHHVEWFNHKHSPNKQIVKEKSKKSQENNFVIFDNTINYSNQHLESEKITALADNSKISPNISVFSKEKIHFEKKIETKTLYTSEVRTNAVTSSKNTLKNSSSSENGKSQLVALLLCIFVGAIGIHRFYLGYIGIGVIQLLTLGACGIWTLIDLIMIITGDLKPKDGDYEKKL